MGKNIEYINILDAKRKCAERIDRRQCPSACNECDLTMRFSMRSLDMALTQAIEALKFQESHVNDYENGYTQGYNDGYDRCYELLSVRNINEEIMAHKEPDKDLDREPTEK